MASQNIQCPSSTAFKTSPSHMKLSPISSAWHSCPPVSWSDLHLHKFHTPTMAPSSHIHEDSSSIFSLFVLLDFSFARLFPSFLSLWLFCISFKDQPKYNFSYEYHSTALNFGHIIESNLLLHSLWAHSTFSTSLLQYLVPDNYSVAIYVFFFSIKVCELKSRHWDTV